MITCEVCGWKVKDEAQLTEHWTYSGKCRFGEKKPQGGVKNDSQKPDLTLIPREAIEEMGKALTFGAKKYSRYNFREGMDISRPIAASLRHIYQFLDGQDIDEETQCIHLGNAMAGLAMALWLFKNKPECDNRYKKEKK